jgi:hypothetical protein
MSHTESLALFLFLVYKKNYNIALYYIAESLAFATVSPANAGQLRIDKNVSRETFFIFG